MLEVLMNYALSVFGLNELGKSKEKIFFELIKETAYTIFASGGNG